MLKILLSILGKIFGRFNSEKSSKNVATLRDISGSQVTLVQIDKLILPLGQSSPSEIPKILHQVKTDLINLSNSGSTTELDPSDIFNRKIDQTVELIKSGRIQTAKHELFKLLGEAQSKDAISKKALLRIYNNLGLCFNVAKDNGGDFDEAIKFFELAVGLDSLFSKARVNLATAYLNKGGEENIRKAYAMTTQLWKENLSTPSEIIAPLLSVLSFATYRCMGLDAALRLSEDDEKFRKELLQNEDALCQLANFYLEKNLPQKAFESAEAAAKLIPTSFQAAAFVALSQVALLQDSARHGYYQIAPQFDDVQKIEDALTSLRVAKALFKEGCDKHILEQVKLAITTCYLWQNRISSVGYAEIRQELNTEMLGEENKRHLGVLDFASHLKTRDFDSALRVFIEHQRFEKLSAKEKERVAMIFFFEGGVEQAEELFKIVDKEMASDYQFWLERSAIAVLLNDKNMAIQYVRKARETAKSKEALKKVLSHYNAIMMRYAASGEAERLVSGMFEYDKEFPEEKALISIKAEDAEGQISQELKDFLMKQKKWFEAVRDGFCEQPLPSYSLEEILNRPYVDVIATGIANRDIKFVTPFHFADENFQKECKEALLAAKTLIFDYASLLNLSKTGLLRDIEKLGKRCVVSKDLFRKIQNELLLVENEELRNLWDFLRRSKEFEMLENNKKEIGKSSFKNVFEDWLIDSLILAEADECLFLTDDLRLLQFARGQRMKSINSFALLKEWKATNVIDSKIYSESLGDYAERFYRFITFNGDDLFHIVLEDKGKITWRTFFLANEIFSPGADPKSFTTVFVRFTYLLWQTSYLVEDKYSWLTFFTEIIDKLIRKISTSKNQNDLFAIKPIFKDFVSIWAIVIKQAKIDELRFIEKRMSSIVLGKIVIEGIIKLKAEIQKRISKLE